MTKAKGEKLCHKLQDAIFGQIHGRFLIYNTCWEDPRIDRALLDIGPDSKVLVITSAGCNVLDYLLDEPRSVAAVDVNPRQNALLELKCALLRRGVFEDFFDFFGHGMSRDCHGIYRSVRPNLSAPTAAFWDEKIRYFEGRGLRKSFYYHGTSGTVAWLLVRVLLRNRNTRALLLDLLHARTLEEQRRIYALIEPRLWTRKLEWLLRRPTTMAMLGVPRAQARLINETVPGGTAEFVRRKLRHVATEVLVRDNYFWRVYLTGSYSSDCCPNYLKPENFDWLRQRVSSVSMHTSTVTAFLTKNPGTYSHFVLLDHQDWLVRHNPRALEAEWEAILDNSTPGSRILLRSAGLTPDFVPRFARRAVRFFPQHTDSLHTTDRVGTYGSLHLAEVQ